MFKVFIIFNFFLLVREFNNFISIDTSKMIFFYVTSSFQINLNFCTNSNKENQKDIEEDIQNKSKKSNKEIPTNPTDATTSNSLTLHSFLNYKW